LGRADGDTEPPDDPADEQAAAPAAGSLGRLSVDFSRYGTWYRIDSWWEGTYLERTQKGAFAKTIAERGSQVKILFNHGFDFSIGDKVLAVPDVLDEGDTSPHMEGDLFDTSYNRDLEPGLRAGAYGSSFMFEVLGETWEHEPEASDYNPDALPERTITEVRLYEAGPVTWPANPEATASLRSGADWYAEQLKRMDAARYDDLVRSFSAFRAMHGLGTNQAAGRAGTHPDSPTPARTGRHGRGATPSARKRRLSLMSIE
jgi:HK97 family phage prohead protease